MNMNAGGPNIAPMGRTFGNYTGSGAPRPAGGAAGSPEAGPPPGASGVPAGEALAAMGYGHQQEHVPHMPQQEQQPHGEPAGEAGGPAGEGAAEAGEAGAAALGAGEAAATGVEAAGIAGALL